MKKKNKSNKSSSSKGIQVLKQPTIWYKCGNNRIGVPIVNKPHIMKFWDYDKNKNLDPNKLFEYMTTKAHWKCPKCGYEWYSTINTRKMGLCPCCDVGTSIKAGYNDALTIVPKLKEDFIQEDNPGIDISKYGVGDKTHPINWTCHVCSYKWKSTIYSRTRGHNGENKINKCPVCGKNKRVKTFDEIYPELEKWYSDKNPIPFKDIQGDYQAEYLWECPTHGTFKQYLSAMIRAMNSKYHGCPYCANKKLTKANSLKKYYPALYKELSMVDNCLFLESSDVSSHSHKKVWWVCPTCKTKYSMAPIDRVNFYKRGQIACNKCKGIMVLKISHYI